MSPQPVALRTLGGPCMIVGLQCDEYAASWRWLPVSRPWSNWVKPRSSGCTCGRPGLSFHRIHRILMGRWRSKVSQWMARSRSRNASWSLQASVPRGSWSRNRRRFSLMMSFLGRLPDCFLDHSTQLNAYDPQRCMHKSPHSVLSQRNSFIGTARRWVGLPRPAWCSILAIPFVGTSSSFEPSNTKCSNISLEFQRYPESSKISSLSDVSKPSQIARVTCNRPTPVKAIKERHNPPDV